MFQDQDLKDDLEERPSVADEPGADRPAPARTQPPVAAPRASGTCASSPLLPAPCFSPRRPTMASTGGRRGATSLRPMTLTSAPRTPPSLPRSPAISRKWPWRITREVAAGDVVARIDDGDYRLAVQNARDQIGVQQATIDRLGRQTTAQIAAVDQAKAQLASAKAGATRAQLELKRQQDLATRQINSRQALEQAEANAEQAVASVQAADAAIAAASANVDVLKAQQEEARRTLQQYQTALAKAERDLSFTVVKAPFDGVIGNRAVQVGDYVQPTQRLAESGADGCGLHRRQLQGDAACRPETRTAREHQCRCAPRPRAGGTRCQPRPGLRLGVLVAAPDNATGNFTKIVQRLPVRILVPAEVAEQSSAAPWHVGASSV